MSTRILIGHEQGDHGFNTELACLFDSVTGWAFGPLFHTGENGEAAEDRAQAFLDWLAENDADGRDPRIIPPGELEKLYGRWLDSLREQAEWKARQEATMDERLRSAPDFDL
jgi:hypothetical protein